MNREKFDALVQETIEALPAWVHEALSNIEILIFDEPDEELGPEASDLLGLYTGAPLPERSVEDSGDLSDVIYIFRRPHLDLGLSPDELRNEIAATLIHEIAHYFGIDDEHLDDLGWDKVRSHAYIKAIFQCTCVHTKSSARTRAALPHPARDPPFNGLRRHAKKRFRRHANCGIHK